MLYLTIDAGGTFLKSALINADTIILPGSSLSEESHSGMDENKVLGAFEKIISQSVKYASHRGMDISGIGVSFPGPFDYRRGVSLMKHKFSSIYGFDLRKRLRAQAGLPEALPISFIHDANAVLVGEIWKGNARGYANVAVVTLGTGLGFAYAIDNRIQFNELGGPKASIFNILFNKGILEDYVSRRGFIERYKKKNKGIYLKGFDVADIGQNADANDKISVETFQEIADILGRALKEILCEHEIHCLLFGGQISKSFHHMQGTLCSILQNNLPFLRKVSRVENIDHASMLGALHCVLMATDCCKELYEMNITKKTK